MSIAVSPIAFKGFMLGYISKEARDPGEAQPGDTDSENRHGAFAPRGENRGNKPLSKEEQERQYDAQQEGGPALPPEPGPYSALGSQLGQLWPGAATGAVATGAGSLGIDALRGKPLNVKRAIILSMLLGVPLGMAGQLGITEGTQGFKDLGGNVADAASSSYQGLKSILAGGAKKQAPAT